MKLRSFLLALVFSVLLPALAMAEILSFEFTYADPSEPVTHFRLYQRMDGDAGYPATPVVVTDINTNTAQLEVTELGCYAWVLTVYSDTYNLESAYSNEVRACKTLDGIDFPTLTAPQLMKVRVASP
jgi:hypothetical protein